MKDDSIKIVGLSNNKISGKSNWKVTAAIIGIIVLALGMIAGIFLVRQNQNINEEASCVASCPGTDGILRSCVGTTGDVTLDFLCNPANNGKVEVCGQTNASARQFCCSGGVWNTSLTGCSVAATATATATSVSTTSPTSSSSPASTPLGQLPSQVVINDQTPTVTTSCSGSTSLATISWLEASMGNGGYVVDINDVENDWNDENGFWHTPDFISKETLSVIAPTAFGGAFDTLDMPKLDSTKKYYVRVLYKTPNSYSKTVSFTPKNCAATATATSTSNGSSTAVATATSTAKGTATAKSSATATAFPIPETGMSLPTMIGTGFGIVMILVSLALAL